MNSSLTRDVRWHDLLTVRPFAPVVTGASISALRRAPESEATGDFIGGYLGFDARAHHALNESLASLAKRQSGGAFWLSGAYGSGKSHLLGLLALLCDGAGHDIFGAHFPELRAYLAQFGPRLVVSVALDDYPAEKWSLEEIFWREAKASWTARQLGDWPEAVESARVGSRAEAFAALQSELAARELGGVVVLLDELSLFLGGREHRALQNDAAFLQFLGQLSGRAPLWIWAALQKSVEDLGGLEPYALGQIRDRYTLLPLSLAHLPALVEKRLIEVKDEKQLAQVCEATFADLEKTGVRPGFGPREWRALAPFHPHTIELLEAVTARFFSRTRSAMLFCAGAIDLEAPVSQRVYADAIWDYFAPEIASHPDLRPLQEPWNAWRDWMETLSDEREKGDLGKITRFILLARVAGRTVTPAGAAAALDLCPNGVDAPEWARFLLEKLRRGAGFLAVERSDEAHGDRYAIDLGRRIGEAARRQVLAATQTLEEADPRIGVTALRATRTSNWPLHELAPESGGQGRVFSVFWRHSPRKMRALLWDAGQSDALANMVFTTREIGSEESAILALTPPFSGAQFDVENLARLLGEPRLQAALWVWKPRPATRDEWELARETTGAYLAAQDPTLSENRRGRALLEHLEREMPAREAALARVVARLYCEGEVVLGNGAAIEASELAGGDDFLARLEAIADFGLPHIFPLFESIAPRARLLTPSNAESLSLELLRRPRDEGFFAPSLERLARHLGEPLGVAKASAGRWKMAKGQPELIAEIVAELLDHASIGSLDAQFSRSPWGLCAEQLEILLCALLRAGEIVAFDARGNELAASKIGLPLRRSIFRLQSGNLPDGATWTQLAVFAREIVGISLGAISFEEAANLTTAIVTWRESTREWLELARARAAQMRRALRQPPTQWNEFETATTTIGSALETVSSEGAALLARTATLEARPLSEAFKTARRVAEALESHLGELLAAQALLTNPDLVAPPDLNAERTSLLERLSQGEAVLFDAELRMALENWRASYAQQYAQWHGAQHDSARWNSLRRLENSDELRALERLATLTRRRFEVGAKVRAQLETENQKACLRPDAADLRLGRGEATCSTCGLKWGERVRLSDPKTLNTELENGLHAFRNTLAESEVRRYLERHHSPFLEWDGSSAGLWPLLSSVGLAQLDEAYAARRRVSRSLAELKTALGEGGTRAEVEAALLVWLDGGEGLESEDEVEISD